MTAIPIIVLVVLLLFAAYIVGYNQGWNDCRPEAYKAGEFDGRMPIPRTFDARDEEAIALLKSDPDEFFKRRKP
ncbi:hypothetical protein [Mycolicibacterium septicum]|uniref:hypothetical protein n=1 Tax=Mycolicibacterium septicum TaxID=98668 RepID=UPI001AF4F772|nr:hypothetical protein [Mycolicibacterium septicum]QRY51704.1 hypothetical protein JVX95_30735 [Mycolicibacterium septicum]